MHPALQPLLPHTPNSSKSPSVPDLRREPHAIHRRRAADTRAKAAKVIADKAEALMCAERGAGSGAFRARSTRSGRWA